MNAFILVFGLAQQILPAGPVVAGGLADAREPRVALGILTTNLLADELVARPGQGFLGGEDLTNDVHGVIELGTNFPLVRVGAVVVSLQGGLVSRFRLEAGDNDALSSDYLVAFPLNYARGAYESRIRLMHRSSHLGDEIVQNTTLRRLEFDHEEIDALVARRIGRLRAYAGGTLTLASSYARDKHGIQVGADGRWGLGRNLLAVVGVDWQKHSIANGNSRFSGVGGLEMRGPAGMAALQARLLSGATPVGEFFLDQETYWSVALVLSR